MATDTPSAPAPEAGPPPAEHRPFPTPGPQRPPAVTWLAVAVAALALGAAGVSWQRLGQVQKELARRSTDSQAQVAEARALAAQAEKLTQDLQARLGVAEVRLSEVSLQRSQLEELMLAVSRTRDDSLVQDLESAVQLAWQQSQLTGSAQPLISALQAADRRIARAAQPRLNPVQRAIARDIERIQSAALVDVPALTGRIDELVRVVDELPLLNAPPSTTPAAAKPQAKVTAPAPRTSPPPNEGGWAQTTRWWQDSAARWWDGALRGAVDLVRVSRIDRPEAALLAPDQAYFLRENAKLKLLNARLALLSRQMEVARADVQAVDVLLQRYFNPQAKATTLAHASLQTLQRDLRALALPRPDDTVTALATAADGR